MDKSLLFAPSTETIKCPVCGSKHCLKENVSDDAEDMKYSYLCVKCGYMSSDLHTRDSEIVKTFTNSSPDIVIKLGFFDTEREIVWFPSVIEMGNNGWVYPVSDNESYRWAYSPVVDIPETERINYPVMGKPGIFHEKRLAVEKSEYFEQHEFFMALTRLGAILNVDEIVEEES